MTEPALQDLARLWQSTPVECAGNLASRAMFLRREEMRKAIAGTVFTAVLLGALVLELLRPTEVGEAFLISVLGLGAAGAQFWLVLLRRSLWRTIGHSPSAYWMSVVAKARLGIRIGRLTFLGGPPCIVFGAILAHNIGGSGWPSGRAFLLLTLACAVVIVLGVRDVRRERAELDRAENVLRELQA